MRRLTPDQTGFATAKIARISVIIKRDVRSLQEVDIGDRRHSVTCHYTNRALPAVRARFSR